MPKRTNDFQEIVAAAYRALAQAGARVEESALVKDNFDLEREIDILATLTGFGSEFRLAIECRDRRRLDTLEWVDALIGKYIDLPIDKIIAISAKGFSSGAARKAAAHNIELITAQQAANVDWAAALNAPWKTMTHSFRLMLIATLKDGAFVTRTDISADGADVTHADALSEAAYPHFRQRFFDHHSSNTSKALEAKIRLQWQRLIDDPTTRWAEVAEESEGRIGLSEEDARPFDTIIFGVGTLFHVKEETPKAYVINNLLVEQLESTARAGTIKVRWARDRAGDVKYFEVRGREAGGKPQKD